VRESAIRSAQIRRPESNHRSQNVGTAENINLKKLIDAF
jgi:hypothetical protein